MQESSEECKSIWKYAKLCKIVTSKIASVFKSIVKYQKVCQHIKNYAVGKSL